MLVRSDCKPHMVQMVQGCRELTLGGLGDNGSKSGSLGQSGAWAASLNQVLDAAKDGLFSLPPKQVRRSNSLVASQ